LVLVLVAVVPFAFEPLGFDSRSAFSALSALLFLKFVENLRNMDMVGVWKDKNRRNREG
jgi:hypothetical protein